MTPINETVIQMPDLIYNVEISFSVMLRDLITMAATYPAYPVDQRALNRGTLDLLVRNSTLTSSDWLKSVLKTPGKEILDEKSLAPVYEKQPILLAMSAAIRELMVELALSDITCDSWATLLMDEMCDLFSRGELETFESGYARPSPRVSLDFHLDNEWPLLVPGLNSGIVDRLTAMLMTLDGFRYRAELFELTKILEMGRETAAGPAFSRLVEDLRAFGVLYKVSALRLLSAIPLRNLELSLPYLESKIETSQEALTALKDGISMWQSLPAHPLCHIIEQFIRGLEGAGRYGTHPLAVWTAPPPKKLSNVGCRSLEMASAHLRSIAAPCGARWGEWDPESVESDDVVAVVKKKKGDTVSLFRSSVLYIAAAVHREPRMAEAMDRVSNHLMWSKPSVPGKTTLELASASFSGSDGLGYTKDPWLSVFGLANVVPYRIQAARLEVDLVQRLPVATTPCYTFFADVDLAASPTQQGIERHVIPESMRVREPGLEVMATNNKDLGTRSHLVSSYYGHKASSYVSSSYVDGFTAVEDGSSHLSVPGGWGFNVVAENGGQAATMVSRSLGALAGSTLRKASDILYVELTTGMLKIRRPLERSLVSTGYSYYSETRRLVEEEELQIAEHVLYSNDLRVTHGDEQVKTAFLSLAPARRAK